MNKFTIYNLQFTILISALLVTFYLLPVTANAQATSPTPKASSTATASASPENGKSIRDTLRERVEEKLTQLINKPRAFVGKITQISNSSLTIETKSGIKQVKITDEQSSSSLKTAIIQINSGKSKTIKESDLEVGNFVVAMGYTESKDTLEARRILTMTEDPRRARQPIYGIVQSTKDGTFIVKHPKKDGSTSSPQDETWTVKTSAKTEVTKKADGKIEKSKVADIAVDDRIIAVGSNVKNGANTISAELIHVIPGAAHGLLKSPTASPKATKSPTPTATP
ncbi:hypothetical protein HYZ78_04000 [Candidatus Microgenomates bacterium]|nr:hypothetical protein [Candidatus Microgenomates bacterium]